MDAVTNNAEKITTYRHFFACYRAKTRLRFYLRDAAVNALGLFRSIPADGNWVRFPLYHHVFEDERKGFEKQLKFLQTHGEFISIDEAVAMLESPEPIPGRYFAVAFDDGYRNCLTNAAPILNERGAPAVFYVCTGAVQAATESGPGLVDRGFPRHEVVIEYLAWDDLRELVREGMTIGSHAVSHVRLAALPEDEAEKELSVSKETIEKKLGRPCLHFACPFGRPGVDFIPERDPAIARRLGYRSFATGVRGSHSRKTEPMMMEREWTLADWSVHQLRYIYSR